MFVTIALKHSFVPLPSKITIFTQTPVLFICIDIIFKMNTKKLAIIFAINLVKY